MYDSPAANEAARHAGNLRRALRAVVAQCEQAIESMDAGNRPSPYGGPAIFNSSLDTVIQASAALDAMLNLAGSPALSVEDATAVLKDAK